MDKFITDAHHFQSIGQASYTMRGGSISTYKQGLNINRTQRGYYNGMLPSRNKLYKREIFSLYFIWLIIGCTTVKKWSMTSLRIMLNQSLITVCVFVVVLPWNYFSVCCFLWPCQKWLLPGPSPLWNDACN